LPAPPVEARLTDRLRRGVAVRTQLRALLRQTGEERQQDLVHMLASLPAAAPGAGMANPERHKIIHLDDAIRAIFGRSSSLCQPPAAPLTEIAPQMAAIQVSPPSSDQTRTAPMIALALLSSLFTVLAGCAAPAPGQPADTVDEGMRAFAGKLKSDFDQAAQSIRDKQRAREATLAPMRGLRFKDTVLNQMFKAHPIDGHKSAPRFSGEKWFPRVALIPVTVPSNHQGSWGDSNAYGSTSFNGVQATTVTLGGRKPDYERLCWTFRAKVWTAPTKSTEVAPFLYCAVDARRFVKLGGTPPVTVIGPLWMSKTQSGSLFTEGPRQPMQFASRKFIASAEDYDSYAVQVSLAIMQDMGLDPFDAGNEGNRAWIADAPFTVKDF